MINDRVILLGVAGLAAIATAGWTRQVPVAAASAAFVPVSSQTAAYGEPVPVRRAIRTNVETPRAAVVKDRSKLESAAIIGGGAAAGAAIGGIAGGGKGAAIGAIAGGAGGLVYDRMTHKKSQPAGDVYRASDGEPRNERSKLESAAIIGGGAAAGAAIGGAAGGGKGAAIGAIAGGAGGYVYDRMTKNRQ
jgi:hypothetical protein